MPTPRAPRTSGTAARRGLLVRMLATCWLALYVAVVGGLPMADARAETAGRIVPHWEAPGAPCDAGHHGELCQLCQVLTAAVDPSVDGVVHLTGDPADQELFPPRARGEAANGCRAGPSSRAPPLS